MKSTSTKTAFKLEFEYLHKMFKAMVFEGNYPNGYMLYKVNFDAGKYWFLKHSDGWKVFGDFKLNKKLESIIINKISQHTTTWKNIDNSAAQINTTDNYIMHKTIIHNQKIQDELL
jgi:hypothetical protein